MKALNSSVAINVNTDNRIKTPRDFPHAQFEKEKTNSPTKRKQWDLSQVKSTAPSETSTIMNNFVEK